MYPFKKDEPKVFVELEQMIPRLRYEGAYRAGVGVAEHYGFCLLHSPRVEKSDRVTIKNVSLPAERVALMRTYLERGFDGCTHPVQVCYTTKVPYQNQYQLHLDIVGSTKSAAEVLLIYTALMILKEHGIENVRVGVNSVGGKNSVERFTPEVINYYRERLEQLDPEVRQAFNDDPFEPLRSEKPSCKDLLDEAPQSIAFLTEDSRSHFYEILESLEMLNIPYCIDNRLVGNPTYTRRTIFEVRTDSQNDEEAGEPLVFGQRYDYLAKRAGLGRHVPALGMTITLPNAQTKESIKKYQRGPDNSPHTYIIQLGNHARRATMHVAEDLRKAGIRFRASLAEDKLRAQLEHAQNLNVPVIVIIGHKEATEGTAMLRKQNSRSQVTVPRGSLVPYLRKMLR